MNSRSEIKEDRIYFRYKLKLGLSGLRKISENKDINTLKILNIEGYTYIQKNDNHIYFSLSKKLYRRLKLSTLGVYLGDNKLKFLDFMISRSEETSQNDIDEADNYWYSNGYYYYHEYEKERAEQKYENKQRLKNHNNYYKNKMKISR